MWITSYTFGLKLFDQYILRMVSQGPLNAVVLVDQEKLSEVWDHLPEGDEYLARKAGSRYLLRGIKSAGGGAFHPKTYLFTRADSATLVVGSGNLTRDGIDHGHEAFTSFESTNEVDLPSMRAWAEWMSRLVENEADDILRERWAALREDNPWMLGPSERSSFVANDQASIIDQLAGRLRGPVAALHVTAPFFDRDAKALSELIHRCEPDRLSLYVGAGVQVHGPSLIKVLGEVRDVRALRYEPHNFVHAKLIGVVEPDQRGVLLVGSPNLSVAALLGVCTKKGGNWETAVLREGSGEQVRSTFEGNGKLTLVDLLLENLEALEHEEDEQPLTGLFTLRKASWRSDGRITVECAAPAGLPTGTVMSWADGSCSVALDGEAVTVESLEKSEPPPLLVWLTGPDGTILTNKVPIDDPAALQETLLGSRQRKDSRPAELQGIDDAPLIRIALWANERFIFDPDRTAAFRRAEEAIEGSEAEEASDFWERYAREELQYDPRSQSYRPLTPGAGAGGDPLDELLRELQAMLYAAPGEPGPSLRIVRGMVVDEGDIEAGVGTAWSMGARQRQRAYNLFLRWCRAVGDTRHMLISPSASVVNYKTLVGVIFAAWMHQALERKQLRKLLWTLLTAFVGLNERQPGFLGRIDEQQRREALLRLDPFVMELAAGLATVAMESGWRGSIYDWQPVLRRGLDFDVLLPGEWSVRVVERLSGKNVTVEEIYKLLQERIHYVDDETWCDRITQELGLENVALDLHRAAKVRSWVFVRGAGDPLTDTRLLILARRFLDFKEVPAVAVKTDRDDVMIFEPGKPARARLDGASTRSPQPVTVSRLKEIERQGGSWADLLGAEAA